MRTGLKWSSISVADDFCQRLYSVGFFFLLFLPVYYTTPWYATRRDTLNVDLQVSRNKKQLKCY